MFFFTDKSKRQLWKTTEGRVTVPELLEGNPVGESLSADPDALQHSVALQLVEHLSKAVVEKLDFFF